MLGGLTCIKKDLVHEEVELVQPHIPHLGISLITIRNGVFGLDELFSSFDHLPSKSGDALDTKQNPLTDESTDLS